MFKKDSGAHFTYNLGVGFMRLWLLLFIISLLLIYPIITQPSNTLVFEDRVSVDLSKSYISERTAIGKNKDGEFHIFSKAHYYVELSVTSSDGTKFKHLEEVGHDTYRAFKETDSSHPHTYNMYRSTLFNTYYISPLEPEKVLKEFKKTHPTTISTVLTVLFIITTLASLISLAVGIRQIRVAMKYPRNDVPFDSKEIVLADENSPPPPTYDELMEEFDEAYKKYWGMSSGSSDE